MHEIARFSFPLNVDFDGMHHLLDRDSSILLKKLNTLVLEELLDTRLGYL